MLVIFMILLLIATLMTVPAWPYSRGWGYYPSGGLGIVALALLLVLFLRP